VPVWHKATRKWVEEGRLVVLGITQEQHPDRCRLFAQWQQFDWPILWDPINAMESTAVPIVVAIDEHSIVRSVRPRPESIEREFLNVKFADDAPRDTVRDSGRETGAEVRPARRPDLAGLRNRAEQSESSRAHRELGDALVLWGGSNEIGRAIDAYSHARRLDADDAATRFRLGVAYRLRHDSPGRQPADFQRAVEHWEQALTANPNQYVWRRRIQQFGPRLDKPYPFYDWVAEARRAIAARGESPVSLTVDPYGAEIASPTRTFTAEPSAAASSPDPAGKIHRDLDRLIECEVTLVPSRIRPGGTARVHITMQPNSAKKSHWNNEAEPLRVWVDTPDGWQSSQRLVTAPAVTEPTSLEVRRIDFEVQAPADATGKIKLPAYAIYYVCEDADGRCLFLRQDFEIPIAVDDR
jgi:hypothetical protein